MNERGTRKNTFEWHLQSTLFHFYSAKAFHQPIAGLCCKMGALIYEKLALLMKSVVKQNLQCLISQLTWPWQKINIDIIPKWNGLEAERISPEKIQIVTIPNTGIQFVGNKIKGKQRFRWFPENESLSPWEMPPFYFCLYSSPFRNHNWIALFLTFK